MASTSAPQLVHTNSQNPQEEFHFFPLLPFEVRSKIWSHHLEGTPRQMYRFSLCCQQQEPYTETPNYMSSRLHVAQHLFVQPVDTISRSTESIVLQTLDEYIPTISSQQLASTICAEARQAVLKVFPDTLEFRILSQVCPDTTTNKKHLAASIPDVTRSMDYILRFKSATDIVLFDAEWKSQEIAEAISKLHDGPIKDFFKIRHVGIVVDEFKNPFGRYEWPHWLPTTGQGNYYENPRYRCFSSMMEECQNQCKTEPIVAFLSLFPAIEKLYIADMPSTNTSGSPDRANVSSTSSAGSIFFTCACPLDGPRHCWPVATYNGAFFVVYDESASCPFPKIKRIEHIRKFWRVHLPRHQTLQHLEIKYIQSWGADGVWNGAMDGGFSWSC